MVVPNKISIEQYLERVAQFSGNEYGKAVRSQFKDIKGSSELAMLAAPSTEELEQLRKAVAIIRSKIKIPMKCVSKSKDYFKKIILVVRGYILVVD